MGSQPQPSSWLRMTMAPEEFDRLAVDKVDFPLLRALKEGDIAPPLSLPTEDGQLVHSRATARRARRSYLLPRCLVPLLST